MKKKWDVFIAYHGYGNKGSVKLAEDIYNYLKENGYKVFFFPKSGCDEYKTTVLDVISSRTFLFVCNEELNLNSKDTIDINCNYELNVELDTFLGMVQQKGNSTTVSDSKIILVGRNDHDIDFHDLFRRRDKMVVNYNTEEEKKEEWERAKQNILEWVEARCSNVNGCENFLAEYSGHFFERVETDTLRGERLKLNLCTNDGKHIVRSITVIAYTAMSFISSVNVIYQAQKRARQLQNEIADLLKDDEFKLKIVITNPNSLAAMEAVASKKIGNPNMKTFHVAQDLLWEQYNDSSLKKMFDSGKVSYSYSNVALPYGMTMVEHKSGYTHLDYIKVDLYSPYIERNTERQTMIISQKNDNNLYEFFKGQITGITALARDVFKEENKEEKVVVIRNDIISESLKKHRRQYFSGKEHFSGDNLRNCISFLEMGISNYKEFRCDDPHYHKTTAEHYYVVSGEQKIIDFNNNKELIVSKGDFVHIPTWVKHATKNKKGTKILFAKVPQMPDDKEVLSDIEEFMPMDQWREWESNYDSPYVGTVELIYKNREDNHDYHL